MKKYLIPLVISISFLVLSVACSSNEGTVTSGSDTEQEEITFKLVSGVPPSDQNFNATITPWMERVTEATDGKVQFETYFSEELVPMSEEVRSLKNNTIDIVGQALPTYFPKQFPLSDVAMLPLKESDSKIAAKAWADLITSDVELQDGKTFSELEYEHYGVKVFPVNPTPEATIATVKVDLASLDSFKGITLRTAARTQEFFVKELGGGSVSMPYTEEFEALSKGTVEGNIRSVADYEPQGFDQLLTNVLTGINFGHFPFVWMMSEEKWNSLPEDVRSIMEKEIFELVDSDTKFENQNKAIEHAKEIGIEFTEVSDLNSELQKSLEEASVNTWQEWIDSKEKEGFPGLEIAKLWRDLIIEHGGKVYAPIMELK